MTAYADTDKAVRCHQSRGLRISFPAVGEGKIVGDPFFGHEVAPFAHRDKSAEEQVEVLSNATAGGSEEVIIGDSLVMQQVFSTVEKLRDADANILILGENGTGKDVIARMLYRNSPLWKAVCHDRPRQYPEQLFESELFGYEKAPSPMHGKRKLDVWKWQPAVRVFLDEIGNLSLPIQIADCHRKALYQSFGKYAGYAH